MHIPIKFYKTSRNENLRLNAYVGIDPCVFPSAQRGGDLHHGIPTRDHPWFMPWRFTQAQTQEMAGLRKGAMTDWTRLTAQAVCKFRGWEWEPYVATRRKVGRYNTYGPGGKYAPNENDEPDIIDTPARICPRPGAGKPYVSKAAKPKF